MGSLFENSIDIAKDIIKDRLSNKLFTTEDSIRYLLFYSIIKGTNFVINPNEITLETKYSQLKSKNIDKFMSNPSEFELDTQIDDPYSNEKDAIEIKYHRKSNSQSNTTSKLGGLLNDMNRLICIDGNDKYLFYLTDNEMNNYLTSKQAPLCIKQFYELSKKSYVNLIDCLNSKNNTKHKHFDETSYNSINNIADFKKYARKFRIVSLLDLNDGKLPLDHYLRVYKIERK